MWASCSVVDLDGAVQGGGGQEGRRRVPELEGGDLREGGRKGEEREGSGVSEYETETREER